jgi:hypothetical protein
MGAKLGSVTLMEEQRLMVFMNGAMRNMFGPKWEEVAWEWRKTSSRTA